MVFLRRSFMGGTRIAGLWLLLVVAGSELAWVGLAQDMTCQDSCGDACQGCLRQCEWDREAAASDLQARELFAEGLVEALETEKLLAADTAADDNFGWSVAVSGTVAIVGAPDHRGQRGAAYVFEQQEDGSWSEQAKLVAPGAVPNHHFGWSVAIAGSVDGPLTAIASCPGCGGGSAYVFERQADRSWTREATLVAYNCEAPPDVCGPHLEAIAGGADCCGCYENVEPCAEACSEFPPECHGDDVLECPGVCESVTTSEDYDNRVKRRDYFGYSVALAGSVAFVGAPGPRTGFVGSVYVFERQQDGTWGVGTRLVAPSSVASANFGFSVAMSGFVAIIGAPDYSWWQTQTQPLGSVYVCERQEDGSWSVGTRLVAPQPVDGEQFGFAVAISDFRNESYFDNAPDVVAVVGAPAPADGAAYVFQKLEDGSWTTGQRLTSLDSGPSTGQHKTGSSVAVSGSVALGTLRILVGAPKSLSLTGAVYSFSLRRTSYGHPGYGDWEAEAKLVAADAESEDEFGTSVALSGSVHVIGARRDQWTSIPCTGCDSLGVASYRGSVYTYTTCTTFRDVPSVIDDSCTRCTGSQPSECHAATCAFGFVNYQGGHCCDDMANVPSVATGSCTECTGSGPAECTSATCVVGFGPFSVGACCHSFTTEPSVVENSCAACTGSDSSSCSVAICASGYTGYSNGTCCRTPLEERSPSGRCQCIDGFYANEETSYLCQPCPEGTASLQDRSRCVCQPGWYEYSQTAEANTTALNVPVFCHETKFTSTPTTTEEGCIQCGQCLACSSAIRPAISVPYVQMFGSDQSRIDLFRCALRTGCFAANQIDSTLSGCKTCPEKSLPLTAGCQPRYTGHFCGTCDDNYEMRQAPAAATPGFVTVFECVPCEGVTKRDGLAAAAVVGVMAVAILLKNKVFARLALTRSHMAVFGAYAKSMWQPVRILITYAQVLTELGVVLSFSPPEGLQNLMDILRDLLSVTDIFASAKCLGFDTFYHKWRVQVILLPAAMMAVPLVVFLRRLRKDRQQAAVTLTAHSFIVVFFCYPRICSYCFAVFIYRTVQLDPRVSVLLADDRILYEDEDHLIYKVVSIFIIVLVAIGAPVWAAVVLYRERARVKVRPATVVKARVSQVFGISPEEAGAAIQDIRLGARYGFLTAAFKPEYFMAESLDMLRKLSLLGLVLLFDRGSVAQLLVTQCISIGFLCFHLKAWPCALCNSRPVDQCALDHQLSSYFGVLCCCVASFVADKLDWDNTLRMMTEVHVSLTISVALVFQTHLDVEAPESFAATHSSEVSRYNLDLQTQKDSYDVLLLVTFVVCVPGLFVMTIAAKLRQVKRALVVPSSEDEAATMAFAFQRFRLGLASSADTVVLKDFIEGLGQDEHSRAGARLWRDKELVAHFSSQQMGDLLSALEQGLPTSQQLGYHFTDLDSARLILTSLGIRASTVGQLGGGVSICLASPERLGWERLGGEGFAKACGKELWGSKWHEVMPGPAPQGANPDWGKWSKKLEVVLVLRIPSRENINPKRLLPGRDLVYIVPAADCVGKSGDANVYLSNTHIEKVLVLKPPDADTEVKELDRITDGGRDVRVLCTSSRDGNGAMVEVSDRKLGPNEHPDDLLLENPHAPWCPIVASFTATVKPLPNAHGYLEKHRKTQQCNLDKKLWAENVARFTAVEMRAAIENIRQQEMRSHTLAFFYTSKAAAIEFCEQGRGIVSTTDHGVMVCTKAPHELGWSKNCGGRFVDTASCAMWGAGCQDGHASEIEAVLVLGVPTAAIQDQLHEECPTFTIPQELMLAVVEGEPQVYANAHIHKNYVLKPDSSPPEPSAGIKALFECADTDGDGTISRSEAMAIIRDRTEHKTASDDFLAGIWSTFDKSKEGALSIDEFPGFVEAVDAARDAKSTDDEAMPTHSQTSTHTQQDGNQEQQSLAAELFERVDRDGSGRISFDEFVDWWSHKQLGTGHLLDETFAGKMQQQWNELDRDGSGDLDKHEFVSLMTEVSKSEWREAFDQKRQKAYYYNTRTKETRWRQPDAQAAIEAFMATNGLTSLTKPPALATPRPTERASSTTSGPTTINPLSQPAPHSARMSTFDIEGPQLSDTLQRHSKGSMPKVRAASRVGRRSAIDNSSVETERRLPTPRVLVGGAQKPPPLDTLQRSESRGETLALENSATNRRPLPRRAPRVLAHSSRPKTGGVSYEQ